MPIASCGALKTHRNSAMAICALTVLATTALTASAMAAEFASAIDLGSLNGTTGFRLDGIDVGDLNGSSVASAGNVNGDGFDDLIIGAPGADANGDAIAGESYVVFGKASGFSVEFDLASLNGTNGFRLDGIDAGDQSGFSVASAGDVNGDGFDDLFVGAPYADPNGSYSGESYVAFGKASGFLAAINLAALNGANGFRLDGNVERDYSGRSVASAGDVNGDGFDDLIIGAHGADTNGDHSGASYVVFGKASGFSTVLDLAALNGTNGFRLDGINVYDVSGISVASAGDVNGDGFDDLIVGAMWADPGGDSLAGESYVVFGKASGFSAALDFASLNGTTGFRLDGIDAGDYSGRSVASAGDVNGDGFDDLIIGAHGADTNGDHSGASYVVFGKASGFSAALNLASLNGTTGFRLDGIDAGDYSGFPVASAGDVNGDGFDDIIVGARKADPGGAVNAGESYVVFGKASGFPVALDLSALNGANGFRLDGVDASFQGGISVASAGDVNGDGFDDLVVGAPRANPNGAYSGGSYVVFGRVPNTARTRVGSAADQYISGGAFNDTLSGLGGDDELEGRGGGDVLRGGNGRDAASYAHAPAPVVADLAAPAGNTGHAAGDSYNRIENLIGSRFADTLSGNGAANVLTGGGWRDTLTGRGGADIFKYERLDDSPVGAGRDKITDFNAGTSTTRVDRIDLSAIDAKTGPGNNAFTFIGTAQFFGNSKGQLRVRSAGTTAVVEGDINGDHVRDFEIALLNFTTLGNLTSIDFIR